jgi:hypothetical protein
VSAARSTAWEERRRILEHQIKDARRTGDRDAQKELDTVQGEEE